MRKKIVHATILSMNTRIPSEKNQFELLAWSQGQVVIGIDEAGRGCLAGPVVVGAAMLPPHTSQPFLRDSKVMSKKERERAFAWIAEHCAWTVAIADHATVDKLNIYQTTLMLMKQAYQQLYAALPVSQTDLRYVVVDAMPLRIGPGEKHPLLECHFFNYGESLSSSIAAGSIVAKVTRDRLMEELAPAYPAYQFAKNKGYGTAEHIAALKEHGPCAIHRTTFIKNFVKHHEQPRQTSLFC